MQLQTVFTPLGMLVMVCCAYVNMLHHRVFLQDLLGWHHFPDRRKGNAFSPKFPNKGSCSSTSAGKEKGIIKRTKVVSTPATRCLPREARCEKAKGERRNREEGEGRRERPVGVRL